MLKVASILLRNILAVSFVFLFDVSCKQDVSDAELDDYLATLDALEQGPADVAGTPIQNSHTKDGGFPAVANINSGVPISGDKGHCGDGIVNGLYEQCDQNALPVQRCTELGGIAGILTCSPDCKYDISRCLTAEINLLLGGTVENCKAMCNDSRCRGGCSSTDTEGKSVRCHYLCDGDCVSQCEGKTIAKLDRCTFDCDCSLDTSGKPVCDCSIDECDITSILSPHLADIAARILPVH